MKGLTLQEIARKVIQRWELFKSDDLCTVTVGEATAQFHISDYDDLHWFGNDDLGGERVVLEDLLSHIDNGDTFYDVGANVGLYSCLISDVVPDENIVAFEPYDPLRRKLNSNIELNGIGCTVRTEALSNDFNEGKFMNFHDSQGGKFTKAGNRGDSLISEDQLPPPNILKVDVNDNEAEVLDGFGEALSQHVRIIYVEIHEPREGRKGTNKDLLFDVLDRNGFNWSELDNGSNDYHLKATNK